MELRDKVVVVTGAGHGIGAALARRFAAEGATGVAVSDVDGAAAHSVAREIVDAGGHATAINTDVADADQVGELVAHAEREFGPVDLFCSNAGISTGVGLEGTPQNWSRAWSINVMAHVHAAAAVVPSMLSRGHGYLLNTVSAAGLLTCPGDAPYAVTKHAAIGFAEWLSFTYGSAGIRVSALCPLGVRTDMLMSGIDAGSPAAQAVAATAPIIEPEDVAEVTVAGLAEERFLILPHPEVAAMYRDKAAEPDNWLAGMRHVYRDSPTIWSAGS